MSKRNLMLYEAYKNAWNQGARTNNEAIRMAVGNMCFCYWMSYTQVWRQIRRMLLGLPPSYSSKSRKRAVIEKVYELFTQYRSSGLFTTMSDYDLVVFILNNMTQKDILSFDRARKIISRIRKEKRKKNEEDSEK